MTAFLLDLGESQLVGPADFRFHRFASWVPANTVGRNTWGETVIG